MKFVCLGVIMACVATLASASDCPNNEILDLCPPINCEGEYCPLNRKSLQECPKPKPCGPPRCVCNFNFHRNMTSGLCIRTVDCPPFPCKGDNEEYQQCPGGCPPSLLFQCLFVLKCRPQCGCRNGFQRNTDTDFCEPSLKRSTLNLWPLLPSSNWYMSDVSHSVVEKI